jgi:hypothetical protein
MSRHLTRRQFSLSSLAAVSAVLGSRSLFAAPPSSPEPKVSTKPYPPLSITPIPEAFEDRYDDLGGVLDLTNGVIWGYEPFGALVNYSSSFYGGQVGVHQSYLDILAMRALTGATPEEAAIFAAAYQVAAQRTWRWPTVFEAREAVAKGLFTFGEGGVNLYFASPLYDTPGVSYFLSSSRWTSSEVKGNYAHAFGPANGGTAVITRTSGILGFVVSQL